MSSLSKTDENLSASLLNITALENSLVVADEKYRFMQKLRNYVTNICDFLQVTVFLVSFCLRCSLSSFIIKFEVRLGFNWFTILFL